MIGTWEQDRLNGPGEIKNVGKETVPVVFQNDMIVTGQVGQAESKAKYEATVGGALQFWCYSLIVGGCFVPFPFNVVIFFVAIICLVANLIYGCEHSYSTKLMNGMI